MANRYINWCPLTNNQRIHNKTVAIASHLVEWPLLKKKKKISIGKIYTKWNPSIIVKDIKWCSHYGKWHGDSSKY